MSTPAEIKARLEADRAGEPYLLVDDAVVPLAGTRLTVGRAKGNDLPLPGDSEVSRVHAELECIAEQWTVVDDGLSRNGTYVNGSRIAGRTRLRDGDVIRLGRTELRFRRPERDESREATVVAGDLPVIDITPMQREILVALARPFKHTELATPATNQEIADEVHLSLDAVKAHLRGLFGRFGIEHLPQNQKRSRLVAEALQRGVIAPRDL
jgi:pSer/pThr/pTyr-binding forkhead associated (FHA) protein